MIQHVQQHHDMSGSYSLGSQLSYLASHYIDAERHSLFFATECKMAWFHAWLRPYNTAHDEYSGPCIFCPESPMLLMVIADLGKKRSAYPACKGTG